LKKEGSNIVPIKFTANPKPSNPSYWQIGEMSLQVGSESEDGNYKSTEFVAGTQDNEWMVSLTIENIKDSDINAQHKLVVSNGIGEAVEYPFSLAFNNKPKDNDPEVEQTGGEPVEPASITAAVVVIIILIVVGVAIIGYARVKGLLCFAVRASKDEDTEHTVDKEGSDTESTEHGANNKTAADKDENKNGGVSSNGDASGGQTEASGDGSGKPDDMVNGADIVDLEDQSASKKTGSSVAAKMTNWFAALKNSVKSKPEKYEQSESEVKLNDDEKKDNDSVEKVDGEDYAELDHKALSSGPKSSFKVEDEQQKTNNSTTVYAEIRPQ